MPSSQTLSALQEKGFRTTFRFHDIAIFHFNRNDWICHNFIPLFFTVFIAYNSAIVSDFSFFVNMYTFRRFF